MMTRSLFLRALAAGAVSAPVLAACGGGSKTADPTTVPATTAAPTTTSSAAATTTTSTSTTTQAPTTTVAPAKVYPFTGLPVTNEATFKRPAFAVKVNNAVAARPQAGLNQADIVVEEIVEGITRFMAIFQSTDCEKIGSVRSARYTDADLLRALSKPLFAWSGANQFVTGVIHDVEGVTDVGYDNNSGLYQVGRRLQDYTEFFIGTSKAYDKAPKDEGTPAPLFTYRKPNAAPVGGTDQKSVSLQLDGTLAKWTWSAEKSAWLRETDGRIHEDLDGVQLSPANVVIAFTNYYYSGNSPVAETVGEGKLWVMTAGQIVKGTWKREKATDGYTLLDGSGKTIELTPGRTFLELPNSSQATDEPQL